MMAISVVGPGRAQLPCPRLGPDGRAVPQRRSPCTSKAWLIASKCLAATSPTLWPPVTNWRVPTGLRATLPRLTKWALKRIPDCHERPSRGLLQVSRMILASWKVLGTRVHKTFHQAQIFHDKGRQLAMFAAYIHIFRAGHRERVPSAIRCRDRGETEAVH